MTILRIPELSHLPAYGAALERGWSPNTTRNVCAEQLQQIEADSEAFLHKLVHPHGMIPLPDGTMVPMLPGTTRWIWDEGFCGSINFGTSPVRPIYRRMSPATSVTASCHGGSARGMRRGPWR